MDSSIELPSNEHNDNIAKLRDALFNACKLNLQTELPENIRKELESSPMSFRKEVVNIKDKDGCTPLFLACRFEKVEICRFLITVCGANVNNLQGKYEVIIKSKVGKHHKTKQVTNIVTPLWMAVLRSNAQLVELLLNNGARIHSKNQTYKSIHKLFKKWRYNYFYLSETTPTDDCKEYDISHVKYLSDSCLINSVYDIEVCNLLLKYRANVNAKDNTQNTALHFAASEDELEVFKLLIQHGANPNLCNRKNADVLQLVCCRKSIEVFEFIRNNQNLFNFSKHRIADSYELIGCFLPRKQKYMYWKAAIKFRTENNLYPKLHTECKYHETNLEYFASEIMQERDKEFITQEDLDDRFNKKQELYRYRDLVHLQDLMILNRIFGPCHEIVLDFLIDHGIYDIKYQIVEDDVQTYKFEYEQFKIICYYMLFTFISHDTILTEGFHVIKFFCSFHLKHRFRYRNVEDTDYGNLWLYRYRFLPVDASLVADTLMNVLFKCKKANKRLSVLERQGYDIIFNSIFELMSYLIDFIKVRSIKLKLIDFFEISVNKFGHTTSINGGTFLHHAVRNRPNSITSRDEDLKLIKFYIKYGEAEVDARNIDRSTPLLLACEPENYHAPTIEHLLAAGANIYVENMYGRQPLELLRLNPNNTINLDRYSVVPALKRFAAMVVRTNNIPYIPEDIPDTLQNYLRDLTR